MKIILLTPNYAPEQGACAERVRYLAEFLRSKGHEILVVTALPNYPKGSIFESYRNVFHKEEIINEIKVLRYWVYASHSKNLIFRILAMLSLAISVLFSLPKIIAFRPNFVFVQSPPLFLAISGYLIAKICKAKFWLNLSDLWSSVLLDLGVLSKSYLYNFVTKIEIFLYKKADLISGQSEEIIEKTKSITQANHQINSNNKILLYRTGVDCKLFRTNIEKEYQNNTGIGNNKPKIKLVYAGLLGIAQGVLEFCENINLPENVEFHIYGEGTERKLIEKYLKVNAQKQIFLHTSLSQTDLAEILPNFDVALILQRNSIFGTVPSKLYEAMACGLLILYVGGGEGGRLVEKFNLNFPKLNILLNIKDCEKAIKLIAKNIDNQEQYKQKRINARLAAEKYFDRAKILEDFYKNAFK